MFAGAGCSVLQQGAGGHLVNDLALGRIVNVADLPGMFLVERIDPIALNELVLHGYLGERSRRRERGAHRLGRLK
jgi:hypothetical protein